RGSAYSATRSVRALTAHLRSLRGHRTTRHASRLSALQPDARYQTRSSERILFRHGLARLSPNRRKTAVRDTRGRGRTSHEGRADEVFGRTNPRADQRAQGARNTLGHATSGARSAAIRRARTRDG